jgi:integrase
VSKVVDKLTDIQIRRFIKAGTPVAVADGGGLTFTLSAAGTASWILRYRHAGRPRELTLGRYPDKSLSEARDDARKARASVQSGIDVARQKQLEKIQQAGQLIFRELANDYMAKVFPSLADSTAKQRKQHFKRWIFPKIGHVAARDVTTADLVALVENVGRSSIHVAELVLTAVSEAFKHGIARHVVTNTPCAGISIKAICGKPEPTRERLKLTEEELRVILQSLSFIGSENALTTKILLATCVRIGELARAEWEHVDLEGKAEWLIPDVNSKTRSAFVVPLTPTVVGWFQELKVLSCGSKFVLPARQAKRKGLDGGETHFEQRALNAMLQKYVNYLNKLGTPVRAFTPHDLRSTARSWLTSETIGAEIVVAERCLNHTLGGLLAIYDKHDYITERRAVLEKWTEIITALESDVTGVTV